MPLDRALPRLDTWETFFSALPFVADDPGVGRRRFWPQRQNQPLDTTESCTGGHHDGLQRGAAWANGTVAALRGSDKRGVLLRILRDMEFDSAEAIGFISELEDLLVQNGSEA